MRVQALEREAQQQAAEHERERVEARELENMEREHQRLLQNKRQEYLQAQHQCEYSGQVAYSEKRKLELNKKHELERKTRPKRLRQLELQVRKQMDDQARLIRSQHKQQRARSAIELAAAMPKQEVKIRLKQMDDECERRVRSLQEQYEQNINETIGRENVCYCTYCTDSTA